MINTTQTTTYNLTLTAEQFDDLYDTVQEEIYQISDALEGTDLTLNDYEIYNIFKQMSRFKEGNKIWLIQTIQAILKTMMNM